MRLLWNFNGSAARHAARIKGLQADNFQIGLDGSLALPAKGDLLKLNVNGLLEPARFVCTGRDFDLSSADGPMLRIHLELAPMVKPSTIPADSTPESVGHSQSALVR
jgi:hypothetical protein